MSRDHADLLLDQLLREVLGGDRPRDMTARVLARAAMHDRARRTWWISAGSAIAASLLIAALLFLFWPRQYPDPKISGVTVEGAGVLGERGTPLQTGDAPGKIELGGYVEANVAPETAFTIRGKENQEALALDSGSMQFDVSENRGTFDVYVGPMDVHDTGTKFSVDVRIDNAVSPPGKQLTVDVTQGSVEVRDGHGKSNMVRAGEKQDFPVPLVTLSTHAPAPPPATTRASVASTAPAVPATVPATIPATVPAPTTQAATKPAPAASKPAPMPPLNPNVTMGTGSTSGFVVERNGNYSLVNGQMVFDLPPPAAGPGGLHYLPGDYVTITWVNKQVTKAVPATPPPSVGANTVIGPPR